MAIISVRVDEKEKQTMLSFAKFHGESLSKLIRDTFFKRLEDEYDMKVIEEFKANKGPVFTEWSDVKKELHLK